MEKFASVSWDALQNALADVTTGKAAKRVMIGLAYKDGVTVKTLSERYAIPRSTVDYWLDRFEDVSIEEAIEDEDRPDRPPALPADGRAQLQTELAQSSTAFGFTATSWSTDLIRDHIEARYGDTYSDGHIRRLRRTFDIESD
jgi:transposase